MRKMFSVLVLSSLGALAPGLTPAAHARGLGWLAAGLGFRVGPLSLSFVLGDPFPGYGPSYYYQSSGPIAYPGVHCDDRCFIDHGVYYHDRACPVVQHYLAEYGVDPYQAYVRYAPRYGRYFDGGYYERYGFRDYGRNYAYRGGYDGRFDGRYEGRFDGGFDRRYDGRFDGRNDGNGGRFDRRNDGRFDPRFEGRPGPRDEGRFDNRNDRRYDGHDHNDGNHGHGDYDRDRRGRGDHGGGSADHGNHGGHGGEDHRREHPHP
jgi:hypothetical protein